ncbi:MAG: hypothetical protein IKH16_07120 [Selenomonadaceae bacterium]|nr:hypothetical protein [Selenomonadaceae bacterium]
MRRQTTQEIIESQRVTEKPRSAPELLARYNLKRQQYKELKMISDNSPEKREQIAMLYAEAKVLGWALGKDEKKIIRELSF